MAWLKTIPGIEIDDDGSLLLRYKHGYTHYVVWYNHEGNKQVSLDGEFTVAQLEELVEHLKKYSEV